MIHPSEYSQSKSCIGSPQLALSRKITIFCLATITILGSVLTSCQSGQLSLTAEEPVNVAVVDLIDSGSAGQDIGKTPLTLPLNDYIGKGLRFTKEGRQTQVWVIVPAGLDAMEAKIDLNNTGEQVPSAASASNLSTMPSAQLNNINRLMRMVMSSYQALSQKNYDLAKTLAQKAKSLYPQFASPLILEAMANIEQGKTSEATKLLEQAQILDSEDRNISLLIEALQ